MRTPKIPQNEKERLQALHSYKILDSDPEQDFDDITKLASEICDSPVSIITLIDENRQWFKSKFGIDFNETARDIAFCSDAINNPNEVLIVENMLEDERFADNPQVTGASAVRSYAGVPLVTVDGYALGTLCIIDNRIRKLEGYQITALKKLANQAMKLIELRRRNFELRESHNLLQDRYNELEKFSSVVSHDIKSPLNNIIGLSRVLKDDYSKSLDADASQMIDYINQSAEQLKKLVDGILEYYKYDTLDLRHREKIRLREFVQYIIDLLNVKTDGIKFILPDAKVRLYANKMAFGQILYNLIANAIKYNDKKKGVIEIGFSQTDIENCIWIKDNGIGIPEAYFETVFEIFKTLGKTDRFQAVGTGIGLSSVKKMVEKLGGRIDLTSVLTEGSTFTFYLPR